MEELQPYGLPDTVIRVWAQKEGPTLLPVQALAVQRYGLLKGRNLLVVAPTSAGKTFVGEMAAVHAALQRRQAVVLTGTKAVAEEKYDEFAKYYNPLGLRTVLSTRDRREHDGLIERGEFSIAIVIYEKLRALLVSRPDMLRTTGVIVADEVQLLGEEQRGPVVETLLTAIRAANPRPQVIALSAVLSNPYELASWLEADPLVLNERPEKLRKGVLYRGTLHYVEQSTNEEGHEVLFEDAGGGSQEQVIQRAAEEFARRGESTIVFLPTRWATLQAARLLAERCGLPPAERSLSRLSQMEESLGRDALADVMKNGVAFHNADLTFHQRRIVEDAVRAGEVVLTCATPTLAMGVNLPFVNAIIHSRRFRFLRPLGQHADMPISRGDFETEGGRVARLGFGRPFGRAMVCATSEWDRDVLLEHLLNRDFDSIEPPLAAAPIDEAALTHIVLSRQTDRQRAQRFLLHSYAGFRTMRDDAARRRFAKRVEAAIETLLTSGLAVETDNGELASTPLGRICASKGIHPRTARRFARYALEAASRGVSDLEALMVAAQSPDGEEIGISIGESEYKHGVYRHMLARTCAELGEDGRDVYRSLLQAEGGLGMAAHRAMKKALLMHAWLGSEETSEIERRFRTMAGTIRRIGGEFGWLVDAMAAVARCVGAKEELASGLEQLADRLPFGTNTEGVPLARLQILGLERDRVRRLVAAGYENPAALADVSQEELLELLPEPVVRRLLQQVAPRKDAPATAPRPESPPRPPHESAAAGPLLEIDSSRPDRLLYMGRPVHLRPLEWRLARAVAERPRACVPYPELFERLWGPDDLVEPNQIHWHKSRLLKKLRQAPDSGKDPIISIPRVGLMLDLPPEQVVVR